MKNQNNATVFVSSLPSTQCHDIRKEDTLAILPKRPTYPEIVQRVLSTYCIYVL